MKKYLVAILGILFFTSNLFSMTAEEDEAKSASQELLLASFIGDSSRLEILLNKIKPFEKDKKKYPDITVNIKRKKDGNTPLHLAILGTESETIKLNIVRILLNYSTVKTSLFPPSIKTTYYTNINAQNNEGDTPLHIACRFGYTNIVTELLTNKHHKIDVNIQNNKKIVPLHYAILSKKDSIIYSLANHKNINLDAQDDEGNTPLHYAADNPEFVEFLAEKGAKLNLQNNLGETPIYRAALIGSSLSVEFLMAKGANPNIQDIYSLAPIHIAALKGSEPFIKVIKNLHKIKPAIKKEGELPTLLTLNLQTDARVKNLQIYDKAGKAVTDVFKGGETALHLAAYRGNTEAVELLLSLGINPSIKNDEGKTAVDLALEQDQREVLKLFGIELPTLTLNEMISAIRDLNISLEALSSRLKAI